METSQYQILHQAMVAPEDFAVRLRYRSQNGELTERVISPIKMADSRSLLALCLCRENPRRFDLDRCSHIELVHAHEILMPMELKIIEAATCKSPRTKAGHQQAGPEKAGPVKHSRRSIKKSAEEKAFV